LLCDFCLQRTLHHIILFCQAPHSLETAEKIITSHHDANTCIEMLSDGSSRNGATLAFTSSYGIMDNKNGEQVQHKLDGTGASSKAGRRSTMVRPDARPRVPGFLLYD
jgi:hypothetical protein